MALASLHVQNYLIGDLGRSFPDLFPGWTHPDADRLFRLAFFFFSAIGFGMYLGGALRSFDRCDLLWIPVDKLSTTVFSAGGERDDHDSVIRLGRMIASALFWSNEYAFGFLAIYIQLFEHWELKIWDFVGDWYMPIATILSRFSLYSIFQTIYYSPDGHHGRFLLTAGGASNTTSGGGETKKLHEE